ncbi:sterol desaturase family protein [Halioxenophilus sp. WMMB6]|uniref:sterol desaturase family protein n=1 Tax=Halioxenophilus sp. WMMB6 TaxID=3073815 RepID=UPI00295EFAC9|nr:sterol desaturase family protein [Halioxenophilus sp. WMMB6]
MKEGIVWVLGLTVALLIMEILLGRHKGVYRKGDFLILLGSFFVGRTLLAPVAIFLIANLYRLLLPANWAGSLAETPFWIAFPALLLAGEFVFYWVHRWAHQPLQHPILYKIHRTHHTAKHMNVLLDFRLNLSWFFIIPSGWINGLALYLGMTEAVTSYVLLLMLWNTITHSNFRWDDALRRHALFGPLFRGLEHVVVSPGIHHTHHGYGKDGKNYRNFCTILSFWDWLFGTLHIPDGRPAHYGLMIKSPHWTEELFYPLVRKKKPQPAPVTE